VATPFAAGRPQNKLLRLSRNGATAVSATPAYSRAMAGVGLSIACCGAEEWLSALKWRR
jgi:hypothetical protein